MGHNYHREEYLMTKTTPTPDAVDDDDFTAILLQIRPPKMMTMTGMISAQQGE
jgi:hypothetical protein